MSQVSWRAWDQRTRDWVDVSVHFLILNFCKNNKRMIIIYSELAAATTEFADSNCICWGSFGSVFFTVQLRWMGGAELAIKKLDLESMQGKTEFLQEVQVLTPVGT
jgi:hypothetical protein